VTVGLHADTRSNLNRWKKHFCQPLNVHGVNDVTQSEIHTGDMAIEKPKKSRSPSIDRIPAELIQAGDRTVRSNVGLYRLTNTARHKEELNQQRKES
jgi:hypothetical protein